MVPPGFLFIFFTGQTFAQVDNYRIPTGSGGEIYNQLSKSIFSKVNKCCIVADFIYCHRMLHFFYLWIKSGCIVSHLLCGTKCFNIRPFAFSTSVCNSLYPPEIIFFPVAGHHHRTKQLLIYCFQPFRYPRYFLFP